MKREALIMGTVLALCALVMWSALRTGDTQHRPGVVNVDVKP